MRKKISLLLITMLFPSYALAVEMNGVPPNVQGQLEEIANNNPDINFRYGVEGSITVETPDNTQRYCPLLPDSSINQAGIAGNYVVNPDGSVSFGDGGVIYVPIVQGDSSYPSLPESFNPPMASEIPANVVFPPGFIAPINVTVNMGNIPPLNASSYLENLGITDFQQGDNGTITYNGQQYQPFFGLTGMIGVPEPGASPDLIWGEDGSVAFPDGSIYFPVGMGQAGTQMGQNFPQNFQITQNSDGSLMLPADNIPQGMPLPPGSVQNEDGSITLPQPPTFMDEFMGVDPQFVGATTNSDGTYTLADGSIVQAPPIVSDGFNFNPRTGIPEYYDGMELQFDHESALPIDPVSGEPFIPGTMEQTRGEMGGGLFNIQMDPATGFPVDPASGQPFDPMTGQIYDNVNGFTPPPPDNLMGRYVPGKDMNSQRMRR